MVTEISYERFLVAGDRKCLGTVISLVSRPNSPHRLFLEWFNRGQNEQPKASFCLVRGVRGTIGIHTATSSPAMGR